MAMDRQLAELWVSTIKKALTNRNLVSVAQRCNGDLDIYTRQSFKDAYIVEYSEDDCTVAVRDSYGLMTGAEQWSINPDRRTIAARTTNGLGQPIQFCWAVDEDDGNGKIWSEMSEYQEALWAMSYTKNRRG